MCVLSMIGDHYREKWHREWPVFFPVTTPTMPTISFIAVPPVSREEFDALKLQVDEMVSLLKRAKIYDEEHGEPECEIEEKMALLREVARLVGVDLKTALEGQP